ADACNDGTRIWVTGDSLTGGAYGLQGLPETGGDNLNSYGVPFGPPNKTGVGDVEIYRPACVADADAGPDVTLCGSDFVQLDASASLVSGRGDAPQYRWLLGSKVVRDWLPDPRFTLMPSATGRYRLEVKCGRCACFGADDVLITVRSVAAPAGAG